MKNFLNRRKDESSNKIPDVKLHSVNSATQSTSSHDSFDDLHPMFANKEQVLEESNLQPTSLVNDPNLNLNPSISNATSLKSKTPSMYTENSTALGGSVFSNSGNSSSTRQSSYLSRSFKNKNHRVELFEGNEGQALQVIGDEVEISENQSVAEIIGDRIRILFENIQFVMVQYSNSSINLTTAVINCIDCLKAFITITNNYPSATWYFDTYNNENLRKILKTYLHLYDNLLQDEVYIKLKLSLMKNFSDFASTLNHEANVANQRNFGFTISKPQNYAIGVNSGQTLPNEESLSNIIDKISKSSVPMKEQNGSFIAPVTRGISKSLNVLCLYFGFPNLSDYHYRLVNSLHELYDDVHFMVDQNKIELAASTSSAPISSEFSGKSRNPSTFLNEQAPRYKFKLPFRIPTDMTKPPISLSISVENSIRTSGTIGGYIYPMIDLEKSPELVAYTTSKFALSCGHVCLNSTDSNSNYPHVSSPSSVLIQLYKQALVRQYSKISNENVNNLTMGESKAAYKSVINQLGEIFPERQLRMPNGELENRNLPIYRFGQIIWGERTLIEATKNDKKLSDLAIIKVNKLLKCDQNYLGDDVAFNEFDPALMFDNLYVRAVIDLNRNVDEINLSEVDLDANSNSNNHGLPVFKYGSTTKYTRGSLNGIKLVYWLDGAIHSSEFVVNSHENNSSFAAGGDSGAWILAKLEDCKTIPDQKGLGVVGMLHSYDGEHKQFGLYTPMCEILERLEQVTKIRWGVVGVPQKDNKLQVNDNESTDDENNDKLSKNLESSSDDDDDDDDDDNESEYSSGLEGANPPEID